MKRQGIFIFVAKPGAGHEAKKYLGEWLRSLDGHPGYLGGAVLEEVAGELRPETLAIHMDFESTESARALLPRMENTVNPLYPDDKNDKSPDQGGAFFDGTREAIAVGEGGPDSRCAAGLPPSLDPAASSARPRGGVEGHDDGRTTTLDRPRSFRDHLRKRGSGPGGTPFPLCRAFVTQ